MINANVLPTCFNLQNILDSVNTACNASSCNKGETAYMPKAEYYEVETGFVLEVELPGVKKENLDLNVEKNMLSVKATRERKDEKFTYERKFRLADDIDTDNIKVAYENGVLSFNFTKKQQAFARKLEVA